MKLNSIALLTASSLFLAACGSEKASSEAEKPAEPTAAEQSSNLDSIDKKLSYIVGTNLGGQFANDDIQLDMAAFQLALADVKSGTKSRLSQEQVQETIQTMQARIQEKQQAAQAEASAKNQAAGKAYLEANAKKDGVVVTESGLQYKELVAGDGEKPSAESTVVVHYKGTLIDGTQFDSSYDRGQPAEFPVTGVIQGWIEALQLMNVGDKFELTIPSELAYGTRGSGPTIGPDSTLVFEVELLEIKGDEK